MESGNPTTITREPWNKGKLAAIRASIGVSAYCIGMAAKEGEFADDCNRSVSIRPNAVIQSSQVPVTKLTSAVGSTDLRQTLAGIGYTPRRRPRSRRDR
jgi:hypothetical protein